VRRKSRSAAAVAIGVGAVGLFAAVAIAGTVVNGSFEHKFKGWKKDFNGAGQWVVESAPGSLASPPPKGDHAAYTHQGDPSSNVLYQDVKLARQKKHDLSFILAYHADAPGGFVTPENLNEDPMGGSNDNEQFRMDVMKPSAGLRSLDDSNVLKKVYRTEEGYPTDSDWFTVEANLTKFAGRTVRLRFVEVDNQGLFTVGLDGVKVRST
jgi:hypothetical protein